MRRGAHKPGGWVGAETGHLRLAVFVFENGFVPCFLFRGKAVQ
jgi:hypothetical protein